MSGLPPLPPGFKLDAQGGPSSDLPPLPPGFSVDAPGSAAHPPIAPALAPTPTGNPMLDFITRPGTPLGEAVKYGQRVGSDFMSGFETLGHGVSDIVDHPTGTLKEGNALTGVPRAFLGAAGAVLSPVSAAISPVVSPIVQPVAEFVDTNVSKPIERATGYPSDVTTPLALQLGTLGIAKGAGTLAKGGTSLVRGGTKGALGAKEAISEFGKIGESPTLPQATAGSNSPLQYLGRLLEFTPGGYLPFRGRIQSQLQSAGDRIADAVRKAGNPTQLEAGQALQSGAQRFAAKIDRTQAALEARLERAVPGSTLVQPTNTVTALKELTRLADSGSEVGASTVPKSLLDYKAQFESDVAKNGGVTFEALKAFRTKLGATTPDGRPLIGDIATGPSKYLYGQLTKDMEATASASGQEGLVKMRNSYYASRKGELEDVFEKRIKLEQAPEQVYRSVRDSDFSQMDRIMRQLNPQQRRLVAGQVLKEMGKPTPGEAAGDTAAFSLDRFDTNFEKFNGTASKGEGRLNALFKMSGTEDLRAALKEISAVSERFKSGEKFLKNPSQSAVVGTQLGALGVIGGLAWHDPVSALYMAGVTYGVPYALVRGGNSAGFLRLIADIGKQNKSTLPAHILRMSTWVQRHPEYAPAMQDMLQKAYTPPPDQPNQPR